MVGDVNLRRNATVVALVAVAVMGAASCSSGGDEKTARLEAEVAALKSQATSTTVGPTTTTVLPTTTTVAVATTTTAKRVVTTTPTTRLAVTAATTKAAPTCSVRALASPVTRGMTQTIYVTSNLPGQKAVLGHQEVAMDASGSAQYSFAATGGYMDQYGRYSPKTVTVTVPFYTKPCTLNMVVDEPAPPLLTSCKTTYLAIGPS